MEDHHINKIEETYYNVKGNVASRTERVHAAKIRIDLTNNTHQVKFQVLTHNNMLFNPLGAEAYKTQSRDLKLKVVSEKTFDNYVKFLKTKNNLYMTYANRSFIDG